MPQKIIFYNPVHIWKHLESNPHLLNKEADIEGWKALGQQLVWTSFVDRTGTIPHFLNDMEIVRPLPEYDPSFSMSTSDVFKSRWEFLLSKFSQVHLLWSGGIDSSLMLTEAVKHLDDARLSRITVTYNQRSLDENQIFFDQYLKKLPFKFKEFAIYNESSMVYDFTPDEVYISGEYGDQMYTSTISVGKAAKNGYKVHEDSYIGAIQEQIPSFLDELIKKCPIEVKTIYQFWAWFGLTIGWQDAIYRIPYLTRNPNVYAFFDSVEFDQVAMRNLINPQYPEFDKKILKYEFHILLRESLKDYYHYDPLGKRASLQHVYQYEPMNDKLLLYQEDCKFI